jgi:hypothetical protein
MRSGDAASARLPRWSPTKRRVAGFSVIRMSADYAERYHVRAARMVAILRTLPESKHASARNGRPHRQIRYAQARKAFHWMHTGTFAHAFKFAA